VTINPDAGVAPTEVYRRNLESGKLSFQRCTDCAAATFFPRVLCAECGARQVRAANAALVHGGVLPSQVTVILSTREAL
jgi:uncharacterized OB-fold protein